MKVAVINFSGNVGKTTVAAHLIQPRLEDSRFLSIESINADASTYGTEVERMTGSKYGQLQEILMDSSSAVVDVGASNVEEFLKLMQRYAGSHEEFDYFVVPVVKEKKQQADTINTIRALSSIGIGQEKILVVFNNVDPNESVDEEFAPIFGLAAVEDQFVLNPRAVIYENEIYDRIRARGKSIQEVSSDPVDYRAKLRTSTDPQERDDCIQMVALKRLAVTANKNLDDVFHVLFG